MEAERPLAVSPWRLRQRTCHARAAGSRGPKAGPFWVQWGLAGRRSPPLPPRQHPATPAVNRGRGSISGGRWDLGAHWHAKPRGPGGPRPGPEDGPVESKIRRRREGGVSGPGFLAEASGPAASASDLSEPERPRPVLQPGLRLQTGRVFRDSDRTAVARERRRQCGRPIRRRCREFTPAV